MGSTVHITETPTIKNAPIVGLIDGNGDFDNCHLAVLVLTVPLALQQLLALVVRLPRIITGVYGYGILLALSGIPVTISYWTYQSRYGKRHNEKIPIPTGNIEKFIEIADEELRKKYYGKKKIPMVDFQDAYISGKADFKGKPTIQIQAADSFITRPTRLGIIHIFLCRPSPLRVQIILLGDVLDMLEHRHEWANFHFTWTHFKFVLTQMFPVVASHSKSADEAEINGQYDRECAHVLIG